MNTVIKPITPEREQELVAKLVDFLSSRYDAGNLYDILRHGLGMDHSDMEALGFQLRDYYEEVEYGCPAGGGAQRMGLNAGDETGRRILSYAV